MGNREFQIAIVLDRIKKRIGRNSGGRRSVAVVKSLEGLVFVWRARAAFVAVECVARVSLSDPESSVPSVVH